VKYVVILGDGMADYKVKELGNKSPLEAANKPMMDYLAANGTVGLVKTVPEGIAPGSDAANLSVLGYNPQIYYTGRSPLEAASMGIQLNDDDVALRCNLVTLSNDDEFENKTMIDYSADEISSEEAAQLIEAINKQFKNEVFCFYPGISYRHCLVWKHGKTGLSLTPPHDILEKKINNYLPGRDDCAILLKMMKDSISILKNHPINTNRIKKGLKPANCIWLWGEGKKTSLPSFIQKYGVSGSVISAVDLIKGIGKCAGLNSVDVEGATGNINTNYSGKAKAALDELDSGKDFVYIHIEAPDECGHRFEIENKVKSIELIDEKIVKPVFEGLQKYTDFKIMVLPDHPTPLSLRTHTNEPVPFLIYSNKQSFGSNVKSYDEFEAQRTGVFFDKGYELMDYFIKGNPL